MIEIVLFEDRDVSEFTALKEKTFKGKKERGGVKIRNKRFLFNLNGTFLCLSLTNRNTTPKALPSCDDVEVFR
jgi:hypothetical protein